MYGLPKWILVEGIPAFFPLFLMLWKNIQEKGRKQVEKGSHQVALWMQWTRRLTQVLIQPVTRLALDFRHKIIRFFDQCHQFFKAMTLRATQMATSPRERLAQVKLWMQEKFSKQKEKLKLQVTQLTDRLQEGMEWIKQVPLTLFSWGQLQFQRWRGPVTSNLAPFRKSLHLSQQAAHQATEWLSKQVSRGFKKCQSHLEPLKKLWRDNLLPLCRKGGRFITRKWKQTKDFFQKKQQRSLLWLENKQSQLQRLTPIHLIETLLSQDWLPNHLKLWLRKWLSHPTIKKGCEAVMKGYLGLARLSLFATSHTLHAISYCAGFSRKCYDRVLPLAQALLVKGGTLIDGGFNLGRRFLLLGVYYMLLYLMMAVMLTALGLRGLGHLLQSCHYSFLKAYVSVKR